LILPKFDPSLASANAPVEVQKFHLTCGFSLKKSCDPLLVVSGFPSLVVTIYYLLLRQVFQKLAKCYQEIVESGWDGF